jgi:hypothetical protein
VWELLASDFAGLLEGAQRSTMLAIQQIIMLGELAVNRVLDNLQPQKIKRSQPSAAPTGVRQSL